MTARHRAGGRRKSGTSTAHCLALAPLAQAVEDAAGDAVRVARPACAPLREIERQSRFDAVGLEWDTPSPPPARNFDEIPVVTHEAYEREEQELVHV